jgi:predicted LPLAT superfamily acyltransferase
VSAARPWYRHRYHSPLSLRIVFATIPRLPRVLHPPIAVVTAAVFFVLLGGERRAVLRNLTVITGRPAWRLWPAAYRVFYSFCDFVVSYCFVPAASHQELVSMLSEQERGAATIDACLAGGGGLVVWTAHVANTEFASRLLELHGRPVNVARVVEAGNPAEARLRDLMASERLRVVDLTDPIAIVRLLASLRNGEIVAMQGDRVFGGAGVFVPFFGRPTRFPVGPFHLAHAAGVPVLPGLVVRTGWLRYRMVIGPVLRLESGEPRDAAVLGALTQAVSFLEEHLRRFSSQWLNFYDFWPAVSEPAVPRTTRPSSTEGVRPSTCPDMPRSR